MKQTRHNRSQSTGQLGKPSANSRGVFTRALPSRKEILSSEQGAILILLAFLATLLFIFIALGIDTGILSISRRDHSSMPPTVGSAALNAFSETGGSFDDRLNAARLRAQEVAQASIDVATTSYFIEGRGYTAQLGSRSIPGDTGFVEAGIWHFMPTFTAPYFDVATGVCIRPGANDCPCAPDGTWNGPCFERLNAADFNPPVDPNTPFTPPTVTSMGVLLKTRDDAPLKAKFAQTFGGQSSFTLESSAIVATSPVRAVFLMDLSRSAHQETHIPYELAGAMHPSRFFNASESAFRITNKGCSAEPNPPNNGAPDTAYVNSLLTCKPRAGTAAECGVAKNSPLGPSDCELFGGIAAGATNGLYNSLFNFCRNNPPIYPPGKNPMSTRPTYHSKADYRCVSVSPTINGVAQGTQHYLVDAFRGPTQTLPNYRGPEPLFTMLTAIQRAFTRFDGRSINGDRIAVIGFDHEAGIDQRIFPLAETRTTDATYQLMQQVFAENAPFALRHQQHMWFPREDAMLNLPDALRVAYSALTAGPEFHYSENHIILVSDGVSECYFDAAANEQLCDVSQAAITESLRQAVDFVQATFVQTKVKFSVILIGDLVQPHSLTRRGTSASSANSCMEEDEARSSSDGSGQPYPWVDAAVSPSSLTDAYQNAAFTNTGLTFSNNARFHLPNMLHQAVAATGGLWGAVRPPCQATAAQLGSATCAEGALEEFLDNQCAAQSSPGDLVRNISGSGSPASPIVDAQGRLVCDARCRTREEQIESYIDEIFDTNPYLAVQNSIQVN